MHAFLFTSLAFACAGGVCALIGDLQKRVYLGLACFLAVNALIWGRFVYHLFSIDLLSAAGLFLLSQAMATCAYLGTIYFLEVSQDLAADAFVPARD